MTDRRRASAPLKKNVSIPGHVSTKSSLEERGFDVEDEHELRQLAHK
jgi:hypothetical protein